MNEAAGHGGVALAAGLSGLLAAELAARDVLVVAGAAIADAVFLLSVLFVRDTGAHVALEQAHHHPDADGTPPRLREAFAQASYRVPALRSSSQAGLVNNLNNGLAWGPGTAVPRRARRRGRGDRTGRRGLPGVSLGSGC